MSSFRICIHNLRKWRKDTRIWIIAILLFVLVWDNVSILNELSNALGVKSSIWLYPFLYTQYHQKLIFTIPLLLLYNNAPFIDQNSLYMIARCKKSSWHIGQFLYIIAAAFFYYLFIFLCSVIMALPYAEFSLDWGTSIYTMSSTFMTQNTGHNFLAISPYIISYFTPLQATWFTFLMSFLMAVMLGLLIYICNIVTQTKFVGGILSSIMIIFSCFTEGFYGESNMRKFSPVSWITVDKLDVGGITSNPTFPYCMTVYLVTIIAAMVGILIFRKKLKLDIR